MPFFFIMLPEAIRINVSLFFLNSGMLLNLKKRLIRLT